MWFGLQELEELLAHLGHDGAHVVPSDRVTVVQMHHSLFQVAEDGEKVQATGGLQQMGAPPGGTEAERRGTPDKGTLQARDGWRQRELVERIREGVKLELESLL